MSKKNKEKDADKDKGKDAPELELKHQTHKEVVIKFALLLAVLVGYFGYLSYEYDVATGGIVSALTWSFFVLCTPVADAGFLLDFPLRLLFGIRMFFSEVCVWGLAIMINASTLHWAPTEYQTTIITRLFEKILTTPWPYWIVIALSCAGTFLSIRFGDELMDVVSHRQCKYRHKHGFAFSLVAYIGFFTLIFMGYKYVLESLDMDQIINGGPHG